VSCGRGREGREWMIRSGRGIFRFRRSKTGKRIAREKLKTVEIEEESMEQQEGEDGR